MVASAAVDLTGQWTDINTATGIAIGTPVALYVDGGAVAVASVPSGPPANTAYSVEGRVGQQINAGWAAGETVYARATTGRATLRVVPASPQSPRIIPSIDPRVVDGNKAFTVQSFTELNSKRGSQFEAAFYVPALASGANTHVAVEVGSDPMVVKNLALQFESEEINTQLFRGPTYTGGSAIPAYTLRDGTENVSGATLLGGVTVTSPGTPVGPRTYTLGSEGQGNRTLTSLTASADAERVLEAGGSYLLRINNSDGVSTRVAGLATWYEGPLSTEIP